MAAKNKIVYICSNCGFESAKWAGKCPDCGEWNTMEESVKTAVSAKSAASGYSSSASTLLTRPLAISEIDTEDEHRYHTGLSELDRVLGGGLVKGSLVLISGDPGIGKSTILLQICEYLGQKLRILYVSGEESARQIKLRAGRLGVSSPNLRILAETDVQLVVEHIRTEKPDIVMIDSIQTMNFTDLNSSPGSVTQVRECTNAIMRCSKSLDIPAILVGHVNKDGPSQAMLSGRPTNASGTCVTAVMEGTRPLLAEIQGLATTSGFGTPRRMSTGFDYSRMALILAVLEKRAGFYFSNLDAYLNIVGGLRIDEPAVDLAVAMALVSSLKDTPIRDDTVVFGEIGLAGELRSVSHIESRVSEAYDACVQ